jgi:hypothetical protein
MGHPKRARHTSEAELRALVGEGLNAIQIAERIEAPLGSVRVCLSMLGISTRANYRAARVGFRLDGKTPATGARCVPKNPRGPQREHPVSAWGEAYRAGQGLREIADAASVSYSTVWRLLVKAGYVTPNGRKAFDAKRAAA